MFRSILCRTALTLAAALLLFVAIGFGIWAAFLAVLPYFDLLMTALIFAGAFALLAALLLLTAWLMGRSKSKRRAPKSADGMPDNLMFELGRSLGADMDPLLAFGVAAVIGFVLGRRM
jgi:hypothetical protein